MELHLIYYALAQFYPRNTMRQFWFLYIEYERSYRPFLSRKLQWIKVQNIYTVYCFNCFVSNEIILQLHGLQQKNHNHNSYMASIQIYDACLFNYYSLSILLLKVHHGDFLFFCFTWKQQKASLIWCTMLVCIKDGRAH